MVRLVFSTGEAVAGITETPDLNRFFIPNCSEFVTCYELTLTPRVRLAPAEAAVSNLSVRQTI
jgi:hypothetical protein